MKNKLSFKSIENKKVAVHCAKKEYADIFVEEACKFLSFVFMKFKHRVNSNWILNKDDTCYLLTSTQVNVTSTGWCKENGFSVIEYTDYDWS